MFFPPTHGDLEVARASVWSADRSALSVQVFETRAQVQKAVELSTEFSCYVDDFPDDVFRRLQAIDSSLTFMRSFLLGPKELKTGMDDSRLVCFVVQTVCGGLNELAKDGGGGDVRHAVEWTDYNEQMKTAYGADLVEFLAQCQRFAEGLVGVLRGDPEIDEMAVVRKKLAQFKTKHKDQGTERIQSQLDEVLHLRAFQEASPRDVIRLHQIPSVTRLYQQGQLEEKPTLARPSIRFNNTVCLVREDITKMEVTIIVNSTNIFFSGSGTLDRLILKKGGPELQQECKSFGTCQVGDVKVTPGYSLPAEHIFHVVPPDQYEKGVMRKLYRDVLYRAASMRATSIALPSIGTGMLNYPRRDCAAVAMEEVKRYLETAEPTSTLESIVVLVFYSHYEFIYKSILTVFITTVVESVQEEVGVPSTSGSMSTPRRSLFGSIGNAVSIP